MQKYDCLIIGAGHAGLEAAFVLAKRHFKVALFCTDPKSVANMPCNPSIGGPAKGVVVREIDALGGMQGLAADMNQLQIKLLNRSKGPGTWALRAQIDKVAYAKWFLEKIQQNQYINLIALEVCQIKVKHNKVVGVYTQNGLFFASDYLIITTGTFLGATVHLGKQKTNCGPDRFQGSYLLANQLKALGFQTKRFKTGTPPRLLQTSIDYDQLQIQKGDEELLAFSHFNPRFLPFAKQQFCYLTHTNEQTHALISKNLKKSAMYGGYINGIGPRYCPSIEDKIVRFADKKQHQLFLEPESLSLNTVYIQGLSTSFPADLQTQIVHSIKGLEKAVIVKYAYAIEYDVLCSLELKLNLESKRITNLFFAGQINGTSGYEEAACQGLMAGINVLCKLTNQPSFYLKRSEAYIGVLLEDLVQKELLDPYRLLTSRAEYRLQLRHDNADDRLLAYGYKFGLVSEQNWQTYQTHKKNFQQTIKELSQKTLKHAKGLKYNSKKTNIYLKTLLKQPQYCFSDLEPFLDHKYLLPKVWKEKIMIAIKYEGYIRKQQQMIKANHKIENISLAKIQNYAHIPNISNEAITKLNSIKPLTLGQAQRISGVNLVDLWHIKHYLER